MSTASPVPPAAGAPPTGPRPTGGRLRLAATAALFVGWLGWLGYTALTKSHAPILSRAQAAGATVPVVAELPAGTDGRPVRVVRRNGGGSERVDQKEKADRPALIVKVAHAFKVGPKDGDWIAVTNLPDCAGYTGPGRYLLLLNRDENTLAEDLPVYVLAGPQRPPGADPADAAPKIYPWSEKTADDLRKQVEKLFP